MEDEELRAQLVMSMNLFQGFTTEARVARAKLETRSVQYELAELKNDLVTDLSNLHIDFEVSLENVEIAKRSIEQAEENLRITQLKYAEGLQRESDLLDAITNLSRAQYNLVVVMRTAFSNNFQLIRMVDGAYTPQGGILFNPHALKGTVKSPLQSMRTKKSSPQTKP
jgi:outer membrane protein TolC